MFLALQIFFPQNQHYVRSLNASNDVGKSININNPGVVHSSLCLDNKTQPCCLFYLEFKIYLRNRTFLNYSFYSQNNNITIVPEEQQQQLM